MWGKTLLLVLLHYFHIPSSADKVIWLPNKSIKLPNNFVDGKLPCSGQDIIFPEAVEEGILIPDLSINGLILPFDGELILEEGGIVFGPDPKDNCTRVGTTTYKDDEIASWAQPDVWSTPRFNKATPDAEKVPCYYDSVFFPTKSQFAVKLPDRVQAVRYITIGAQVISRVDDDNFLQSNHLSQQFIVSKPGMLKFSFEELTNCANSLHGCPCQAHPLDIDCKLKYCPTPRCSYPIKPEGHCCEMCGASLLLEITDSFNIKTLKSIVNEVMQSYDATKFDYHVGVLPRKQSERVQVIVTDKGEYTGTCKEVISEVNYKIPSVWVKENKLFYSGNPTTQAGLGGKIVVSVFFLVVATMGALFGYYYRSSIGKLRDLRGGIPHGMLARLQRRTESVMSLARRDSTVSTATTAGTAFRNPMYSSMRERVQIPATEEERDG